MFEIGGAQGDEIRNGEVFYPTQMKTDKGWKMHEI